MSVQSKSRRLDIPFSLGFTFDCNFPKDYPVAIWAVHRLGGIITYVVISGALSTHLSVSLRPSNPSYLEDELAHQLKTTKAKLIIAHPAVLTTVCSAARKIDFSTDRIVLLEFMASPGSPVSSSVDDLVAEGLKKDPHFTERRLAPREAKTKVAFLSFSSGTTGTPKVCSFATIRST